MRDIDDYLLGEDSDEILLQSREENYHVLNAMLRQARWSVDVMSRHFDGKLFDTVEFVTHLQRLVRNNRRTRIRVLLKDSQPLINSGHRIIELSRRLSSYIEIRDIHEEYNEYNEAFFIVDKKGIINRQAADRFVAVASFHAPSRVQAQQSFFEGAWAASKQSSNVRRLYI